MFQSKIVVLGDRARETEDLAKEHLWALTYISRTPLGFMSPLMELTKRGHESVGSARSHAAHLVHRLIACGVTVLETTVLQVVHHEPFSLVERPEQNDGVTSSQMRLALPGAIFVWCKENTQYAEDLAKHVRREDLQIKPRTWFSYDAIRGLDTEVVLDHMRRSHIVEYELAMALNLNRIRHLKRLGRAVNVS